MTGPEDSEAAQQQGADTAPDGTPPPAQRAPKDQPGGRQPDGDRPGGEFRDWAAI